TVVVNGTAGDDAVLLAGSSAAVDVSGLSAMVHVSGAEALDRLTVNGQAGADTLDASGVVAGAIPLTLNGGQNDDLIIGGAGNDILTGAQGNDTVLGHAGDDTITWNPGDGSDM